MILDNCNASHHCAVDEVIHQWTQPSRDVILSAHCAAHLDHERLVESQAAKLQYRATGTLAEQMSSTLRKH